MPHFMREFHAITCAYFEGRRFIAPFALSAHLRLAQNAISALLQEDFPDAALEVSLLSNKVKVTAYRDAARKDGYQIIFDIARDDAVWLQHLDTRSVCDFAFLGL